MRLLNVALSLKSLLQSTRVLNDCLRLYAIFSNIQFNKNHTDFSNKVSFLTLAISFTTSRSGSYLLM